ncbi:sodium-dependent transporter [Helicobacter sp. 12S02634-8]|uniref:sodium-dependent transporter n=1 Tax=Helicobacter sp. 12S02634-8 TaxID=1476199 RepID=UPI000BA79E74|nr:sodium-dependent transporter [Helicobacter sp. 12S02634-8]PAF47812.1 sodium-dependent transporter [Helicobacter sp. 12S02634-8]
MKRQNWSNTLTYLLTVAGATIGFGATWRFPYLVGENGGGAYVLVFIIAMIFIGIPIVLVENVIGRRMMSNSVDAFGGKLSDGREISRYWKLVGYMGLIGCFGIIAYYMVLGGWVFVYIFEILTGNFNLSHPITKDYTNLFYEHHIDNNPLIVGIFTLIFIAINWVILRKGIIDGIERAAKWLMPLLFLCLVVIIIRNLTLENAMAGVKFYLVPDFSKLSAKLFIDVLGQVFFALSLGFGVMITLSSYLNKKENLFKTATFTGVINTIVAILAGFMIFPVLFSAGLSPDSGPSLVFKTLPIAFSHIYFGSAVGVLFFLFLLTAALTTSLTLYQVIISVLEEKFKFSKKSATNWTLIVTFLLGNIPSILAYGPWRDIIIIKGKNIFDSFDFISGNIFFILTALLCCIYVGWVLKKDAISEISNQGKIKTHLVSVWFYYIKFIAPIVILIIFIFGITQS